MTTKFSLTYELLPVVLYSLSKLAIYKEKWYEFFLARAGKLGVNLIRTMHKMSERCVIVCLCFFFPHSCVRTMTHKFMLRHTLSEEKWKTPWEWKFLSLLMTCVTLINWALGYLQKRQPEIPARQRPRGYLLVVHICGATRVWVWHLVSLSLFPFLGVNLNMPSP